MHKPKPATLFTACLMAALLSLTGCASLGSQRWKPRVEACQQARDAELARWPERLEDFPVAGLQWLAVIREERELERIERECVDRL